MQILHITPAYWPMRGGAELYVKEISQRFVADGHRVTVLTGDARTVEDFWHYVPFSVRPASQERVDGVDVYRCPVRGLPLGPWFLFLLRRLTITLSTIPPAAPLLRRMMTFFPRLSGLGDKFAQLEPTFDIVHGFNLSWEYPMVLAGEYALKRNIPFIATPFLHVGEPGQKKVMRNYTMPHQLTTLRSSNAVVVQTDLERAQLISLGVSRERIFKVGAGIDLGRIQGGNGARFRQKYHLQGPVVAFVGTVRSDKGAVHLVEAVRRLQQQGMHVCLVLAGLPMGSFQRYYRSLPEEARRYILLLGPISEDEKKDLLAASQVLALPSRVESFGIVLLEAWAYGLPVIGARAGALTEIIEDRHDGLLVPYGDVKALAQAVGELLEHPSWAECLGRRGLQKVKERYTWDMIYEKMLALYQDLITTSGHGGQ